MPFWKTLSVIISAQNLPLASIYKYLRYTTSLKWSANRSVTCVVVLYLRLSSRMTAETRYDLLAFPEIPAIMIAMATYQSGDERERERERESFRVHNVQLLCSWWCSGTPSEHPEVRMSHFVLSWYMSFHPWHQDTSLNKTLGPKSFNISCKPDGQFCMHVCPCPCMGMHVFVGDQCLVMTSWYTYIKCVHMSYVHTCGQIINHIIIIVLRKKQWSLYCTLLKLNETSQSLLMD